MSHCKVTHFPCGHQAHLILVGAMVFLNKGPQASKGGFTKQLWKRPDPYSLALRICLSIFFHAILLGGAAKQAPWYEKLRLGGTTLR